MGIFDVDSWVSDKPYSMPQLHGHEYYELYFLIDGQKRFISQTSVYNVTKGSMVITKPHALHMFEGGPFKRVLISVDASTLAPHQVDFLNEIADETPIYTFPSKILSKINKLLHSMLKLEEEPSSLSEMQNRLSFDYLLYLVSKYKIPCEESGQSKAKSVMHPIVLKTVDYINSRYTEKILINELCDTFHVSKTWLCKKFMESMHTSITNYQILLRVNKAKEKLRTTTCSLETISSELGFSSTKYFGIAFKNATGISPLQYRKLSK